MTIAFIADLHMAHHRRWGGTRGPGYKAPVNQRSKWIAQVTRDAVNTARNEGAQALFVLGDVFDTSEPSPQLVAELADALSGPGQNMPVHILVGNHDQISTERGDHGLISMDGYRTIQVWEKPLSVYPCDGMRVDLVPFLPGRAEDYLPEIIADLRENGDKADVTVLGLHLGIRDDVTPKWLQNAHDSVAVGTVQRCGYDFVVAGNWHGRYTWPGKVAGTATVVQCGALVPTGFDNPGLTGYGSVILVNDAGKMKAVELDGPRFLRAEGLTGAREAVGHVDRVSGYPTFISVRCAREEQEAVAELMELSGHGDYEVSVDRDQVEAAARQAADATTSANTMAEALTKYVANMDLPDGVDREAVHARAANFLAGAAT